MLAGLGGVFAERTGIVNIGLEGMMIAGTWFGAWGSWKFGAWEGVLLGLIFGGVFGLIHAVATVTFNVDHIVSGVAINILGLGGMRFLSSIVYTPETGGSVVQSPSVPGVGTVSVPFLAGGDLFGWTTPDMFGWLEDQGWFFISAVGGVVRGVTGEVSWLTLIALALIPASMWALWRTPWGLRLRSCGEDPHAAESLGVPVYRMKYYGVIISGALAGLGGTFLVLVQSGIYREAQTAGRGFIGLGAMIFGNWRPSGVLAGSMLFGFGDSLRFRGADTVRALMLVIALALLFWALWTYRTGKLRGAVYRAAGGALFLFFYFSIEEVPSQVLRATPYAITLLVLAAATQRLRMPAADGMRYRKGETV
jgi:ABC-type uncharacterized transport system permease subunit